jgi:hypothetical protein
MNDVVAEQSEHTDRKIHKCSKENDALEHCYKQIGIPAVAAAVRYQGDAKNPAYAPVASALPT